MRRHRVSGRRSGTAWPFLMVFIACAVSGCCNPKDQPRIEHQAENALPETPAALNGAFLLTAAPVPSTPEEACREHPTPQCLFAIAQRIPDSLSSYGPWRLKAECAATIAMEEARAGFLKPALEHARKVGEKGWRTRALDAVAAAQIAAGDPAGGRATFAEAIKLAEPLSATYDSVGMLALVAEAQAETGEKALAKATIGKALELVQRTAQGRDRTDSLSRIAVAQFQAGDDLAGAIATCRQIPEPDSRASAMIRVAQLERPAKESPTLRAVLREALGLMMPPGGQASAYSAYTAGDAAVTLAKLGDPAGAREFARRITDNQYRTEALSRIELAAGNFELGMQTAHKIGDSKMETLTLATAVEALAKAHRTTEAMECANALNYPYWREYSIKVVSGILVKQGETDMALSLARTLKRPEFRAQALRDFALAQLQKAPASESTAIMIEAAQAALDDPLSGIGDAPARHVRLLATVASALARASAKQADGKR